MLRRSLLVALATLLISTQLPHSAHAQAAVPQPPSEASVEAVKAAVLGATGYRASAVEVATGKAQLVVTVVNSKLNQRRAFDREHEARRIVLAVSKAIADKPEFAGIQALHVDYVKRDADGGHSRTIDAIDFRKDPQGRFQHHIT